MPVRGSPTTSSARGAAARSCLARSAWRRRSPALEPRGVQCSTRRRRWSRNSRSGATRTRPMSVRSASRWSDSIKMSRPSRCCRTQRRIAHARRVRFVFFSSTKRWHASSMVRRRRASAQAGVGRGGARRHGRPRSPRESAAVDAAAAAGNVAVRAGQPELQPNLGIEGEQQRDAELASATHTNAAMRQRRAGPSGRGRLPLGAARARLPEGLRFGRELPAAGPSRRLAAPGWRAGLRAQCVGRRRSSRAAAVA